jgi:hypothetical protein
MIADAASGYLSSVERSPVRADTPTLPCNANERRLAAPTSIRWTPPINSPKGHPDYPCAIVCKAIVGKRSQLGYDQ